MSGDSAFECSPTIGSKRRRAAIGDGDAPATKKSFTDAEIAAEVAHSLHIREQRRAEVRAIYLNYGTLLKGSESGSEALAFQGLLDCANGSLGARRLAARLVPRFLPRFPSHVEQAFRLLSALYGHGQPFPESRGLPNGAASAPDLPDDCVMLEEAIRRDALRGLGNVLEAAVRKAERNVPVVMELVLFLMSTSGGGCASDGLPLAKTTSSAQPSAQPSTQPSTQPAQPQPMQPQPVPAPPQGHHEASAASQGHGLKHRYRRNAEAAANAEANGRSAQPSPQPPPAPPQALPQHSARNDAGTDGCGKISSGADGTGGTAVKISGGDEADERSGNGPSAAAGTRIDLAASPEPDSDAGVIRSLLFNAFCLFPRVVLAACFQPFRLPPKQRGPDDCQACELMLKLLLLRTGTTVLSAVEPPVMVPPTAARNVLADSGGMDGNGGGGVGLASRGGRDGNVDGSSVGDGSGGGSGPEPGAVGGQADDGGCLAAQVLAHVPETQAWLRLLAAAMAQGKTQHMLPASVQAQLERLLLYCTATAAPAAAAPAAAGKVSPRASPQGATAAAAPRDGSGNVTPARQGGACKPDGGAANTTTVAAQSMVGSDDNSRSVPMDLDHSISTAVRPEGSGAATAVNAAVGAGAASGTVALAGPPDTAATPAPPPPPLPQHSYHQHQHQHPQHEASSAAGLAGPAAPGTGAVAASALPPPLPPPPPPPPPLPLLSYRGSDSSGLRGGPVCRAEACLYIGGLPPGLTEAALVSDLSRLGSVESVHPFDQQQVLQQHPAHGGGLGGPQVPLGEEVYVVFVSLRDAAICYEAVTRTCRFGGTRPLVVEFCSAFPADSPAARRCVAAAAAAAAAAGGGGGSTGGGPSSTASEFVWVSLSAGTGVTPEAVVAALQAAALPVPQQILQVAGRAPGMLLHMASAAIVPQVAACLQAHFTPPPLPLPPAATSALSAAAPSAAGVSTSGLPPPPPMLAGTGGAPLGLSSSAQSGPGGHYGTALHMHHPGGGGGGSAAGPMPELSPINCRTIWIGQLHESVRDEELLSMCRQHGGDVVGHRILRGSHCAFVDFASQAGAEAAKRALHGARLGPQHIRVEWKLDSGPPPRAPPTQRHANVPLPGAVVSGPVGGGLYGLGPSGPGLAAAAAAGPQGMGALLGVAAHGNVTAATGHGMAQQPTAVVSAGIGLMGQAMTPQAVAAANLAAAAAAAAARGAFPGSRSGADRWAPVVIPPPAPTGSTPATTGMGLGQGAGGLTSGGAGFLNSGQAAMQGAAQQQTASTPQQSAHLQVGPLGTGVMNPAVAAVARQAAPILLAHQQLVAGLLSGGGGGGGSGGVMHTPHNSLATPQQGPTGFAAQPQPQHLHPHSHPHTSGSSGGGALPHQTLSSSQAHAQTSPLLGHLHNARAYPGPPPLHPQQHTSQQQGSMGLPGHSSTPLPLHQPHALGMGGPSPQQPQQQPHALSHHQTPPQQPQQLRPGDWPPALSHGHSHGMAGAHLGASPGLQRPGGSHAQVPRFEPGSGTGPPLPNSPPLPHDSTVAAAAAGVSGGCAGPPHGQPQQQLQQQAGSKLGVSQSQQHLNPHVHTLSQNQQQLQQQQQQQQQPPLQQPQQQQPHPHPQQQQQLSSGGSQGGVTWQGALAKSGMHMCTLLCTTGGASAASGATPGEREPVTWPATLDVKLRVDLSYVVHSLYSHTAPHARALRRLVTSGGPEQRNKLNDFLSYLADKNRAGVIKLEAAAGLPPRTLYLVPPSEQVCAALGAEWSTGEPFLLALVVPTAGGTAGGNKGG
ncbi:hypothetical protein VOLCADRAFT_121079 [Volvox carteri f. nagariensis]|uniref:RRM domain-containing protein n=1 Tax=Volvox carteri f. nagariensis TaxID=3068 RepID=D8U1X9_VOLCA|nr:uncharacterized protein VOLCADRAFT_121079 [Volvox carteri f. nagariensis]EFJ46262.1 hypothetical protein VOLCADRAFT_121079 [Volvox carteri f. nagariensis]|eukprot:XP_002952709.1 hypothetical protein VOLCADRAFT_121079 [Volvox carteri f. nagariensis]